MFLCLFQVWYQVRQCVSAIVVTSVRTHSLSFSSDLLDTYTAIVDSLLQAQLDHIKTHPSLDLPTALDELPLFSGCLMKQACKDSQSKRCVVAVEIIQDTSRFCTEGWDTLGFPTPGPLQHHGLCNMLCSIFRSLVALSSHPCDHLN